MWFGLCPVYLIISMLVIFLLPIIFVVISMSDEICREYDIESHDTLVEQMIALKKGAPNAESGSREV
jgi:hypothetical protein